MHVDRDERAQRLALQLGDVARHDASQLKQLRVHHFEVLAQPCIALFIQRGTSLKRPCDIGPGDERCAGPAKHPLATRGLPVVLPCVEDRPSDGRLHLLQDVGHPDLDAPRRVQTLGEGNYLALTRDHCCHLLIRLKDELVNVLEALLQVRLDTLRVFRLRQDLKQLVVGEKVEAREGDSLRLQVLSQPLLYDLEGDIGLAHDLQQARRTLAKLHDRALL
mmetsp:Transcript_2364/g.7809  ORF Transcript_2364/g.7809 Transcript_2364/m.7809 type:complete len:220 (-) Transcript_2364:1342-2001(-)|eukprot:scaffold14471_cov113-Isochrysis_galbana.AAC.12